MGSRSMPQNGNVGVDMKVWDPDAGLSSDWRSGSCEGSLDPGGRSGSWEKGLGTRGRSGPHEEVWVRAKTSGSWNVGLDCSGYLAPDIGLGSGSEVWVLGWRSGNLR